jgi:hypothetical protein
MGAATASNVSATASMGAATASMGSATAANSGQEAPRSGPGAPGNYRAELFLRVAVKKCFLAALTYDAGEVRAAANGSPPPGRVVPEEKEDDMGTASRPRGTYGTRKKNAPGVIFRAMAMHNGINGDPNTFTSPVIAMATFLALVTALITVQQLATETRTRGTAKARDVKLNAVWTAMGALKAWIQGLADVLDPDAGAALIQAGGLLVEASHAHQKAALTASLTSVGGLVHLAANATLLAGRAAASKKLLFTWQISQDGKIWSDIRSTAYASTDVTGLTPLTTYFFRVSVTVGKVAGPWSQPVSILVTH